jgi:hypothetical protein
LIQVISARRLIAPSYSSVSLGFLKAMASEDQVKQYLAYWFQLGKPVLTQPVSAPLLPTPVIQGDRYSAAFEECWQQICANPSAYHLEGTIQTIADLLSPAWEIHPCSRCSMPVPVRTIGIAELECPCIDLPDWPNTNIPAPRLPISSQEQLLSIRKRLQQAYGQR